MLGIEAPPGGRRAYTLKLDEDVLAAARVLAQQQDKTLGEVVSELARRSAWRRPSLRLPTAKGFG
jgi:hypothetical protein